MEQGGPRGTTSCRLLSWANAASGPFAVPSAPTSLAIKRRRRTITRVARLPDPSATCQNTKSVSTACGSVASTRLGAEDIGFEEDNFLVDCQQHCPCHWDRRPWSRTEQCVEEWRRGRDGIRSPGVVSQVNDLVYTTFLGLLLIPAPVSLVFLVLQQPQQQLYQHAPLRRARSALLPTSPSPTRSRSGR